jgi:hypothetical protein
MTPITNWDHVELYGKPSMFRRDPDIAASPFHHYSSSNLSLGTPEPPRGYRFPPTGGMRCTESSEQPNRPSHIRTMRNEPSKHGR